MTLVLKLSRPGLVVFFCCLIPAMRVVAQTPPQQLNVDEIPFDIKQAEILRQAAYKRAEEKARTGNRLFNSRAYQKAIDAYLASIKELESCSSNNKEIKRQAESLKKQISRCYELWSRELYLQAMEKLKLQNLSEAIKLCEQASEVYPPSKARNDQLIETYKKGQKALTYRKDTQVETVIPNLEQRKYNIDIALRQGKAYYDAKLLEKARDKYEEVLIMDPYQSDAINMLYKINLDLLKIGKQRLAATHAERIAEGEWKGVPPILPKAFTGEQSGASSPIKKELAEDKIHQKLKNIIIDHIEFEEVTIPTVVKYLKMRSKQIDPEKIGVNMFLRVTPKATAGGAAAAPADGAAEKPAKKAGGDELLEEEGGEGNADSAEPSGMPTVTMVVDNISLDDAIRYICRAANLKYRIEKYAVVIASQDVPLDDVETRIYPIEHESIDSIGGGDTTAVEEHFKSRGVSFPAGAKIVYDSRISRLIATNTPDNLKKIEAIIHNELNAVDPQVLIQAKFVEVSQNDLDQLGFNYVLSRKLNTTSPITGDAFSKTSRGRLEFDANDTLNRSITSVSDSSRPDTALSLTTFANGYQLDATVTALSQCDSTDILATPRITTLNGQEATIRMVREVYYPKEWSDPKVATVTGTANNSSGGTSSTSITSYVSSIPEFDEPTEEGIILKVTPNVDADRYTITLDMNPVIQRFVGWTDYSYKLTLTYSDGTPYTVTNILKQPIIAARTVETTVSVYDGETIVLGGIISDQMTSVDDKTPILGRLPFFGRFFSSQGQTKKKKNLLIFLTCRLVNPDGTPLRERKTRGLPAFRQ